MALGFSLSIVNQVKTKKEHTGIAIIHGWYGDRRGRNELQTQVHQITVFWSFPFLESCHDPGFCEGAYSSLTVEITIL